MSTDSLHDSQACENRTARTSEKSNKVQTPVILHCAGQQMVDIYEHFEWKKTEDGTDMSVEERNDPAKVLKKIKEYCTSETTG